MKREELKEILRLHELWLVNEDGGKNANLREADLRYANLRDADLRYADLTEADFRYADLTEADFRYADLTEADFRYADLSGADLRSANIRHADLRGADFRCANLSGTKADYNTAGYFPVCPEGEIIGYKKCRNDVIVKLLIPKDAKRSSATTRKCRCDKAVVLEIDGSVSKAFSCHDPDFIYEIGKTVKVDDFDEDRWNECSTGIHFFLTREEAENY